VVNSLAEKANPGYDVGHNNVLMLIGSGALRKIYEEASHFTTLIAAIREPLR